MKTAINTSQTIHTAQWRSFVPVSPICSYQRQSERLLELSKNVQMFIVRGCILSIFYAFICYVHNVCNTPESTFFISILLLLLHILNN